MRFNWSLHYLAYRMLLLGQAVDWTVELKIDISMKLKFKLVTKKSLQQNEGHLPVVPYCTNQCNERLHSFFLPPLITYKLNTQISQHYHENWTLYKTET
jgi:hypothetical protein